MSFKAIKNDFYLIFSTFYENNIVLIVKYEWAGENIEEWLFRLPFFSKKIPIRSLG